MLRAFYIVQFLFAALLRTHARVAALVAFFFFAVQFLPALAAALCPFFVLVCYCAALLFIHLFAHFPCLFFVLLCFAAVFSFPSLATFISRPQLPVLCHLPSFPAAPLPPLLRSSFCIFVRTKLPLYCFDLSYFVCCQRWAA